MRNRLCLLPLFLSAAAQAETVYMSGDSTMTLKEKSATRKPVGAYPLQVASTIR